MFNISIAKAGKVLSIDWDAIPQNAKEHLIEYGLKQKLNDAGSQYTVKELGEKDAGEKAFAAAEVVLAALLKGEVTVRKARTTVSLEEKLFLNVLRAFYKAIFGKVSDKELDADDLILQLVEKTGKDYEAIESAILAKAQALAELERQKASLTITL